MTLAARRRAYVQTHIVEHVREIAREHPRLRSAIFAVAQYWNDQADDEVHGDLVYSSRETPAWPHECPAEGEQHAAEWCHMATRAYFDWSGCSPEMIETWAPVCTENGEQGSLNGYAPYAILRRPDDGDTWTVEWIGEVIRGWSELPPAPEPAADEARPREEEELYAMIHAAPDDDGPRHVLADLLLSRGDPRGEFIALQLAGRDPGRQAALLEAHGHAWLGAMAPFATVEGLVFRRGFVAEAAIYLERPTDAPECSTLEKLWLLPGSVDHVPASARALRSVGPLENAGVSWLLDHGTRVERLHAHEAGSRVLSRLGELSRLRELVLSWSEKRPSPSWSSFGGLESLELCSRQPAVIDEWLQTRGRPKRLVFVELGATRAPRGFALVFEKATPNVVRVERRSFSDETLGQLGGRLGMFPGWISRIELVRSHGWQPRPDEIETIAAVSRRQVICP